MLIYLDIKIPHLQIAHQGGNLEVGNIKIHRFDCDDDDHEKDGNKKNKNDRVSVDEETVGTGPGLDEAILSSFTIAAPTISFKYSDD